MDRTEVVQARLHVLACYQAYVDSLRRYRLDPAAAEVQRCRRLLAHAIEAACANDSALLDDFKRAFASRPLT